MLQAVPVDPAFAGPLIAHRGASGSHPENTLAAIEAAHRTGCRWVEVDAQMTECGGAVLMHDHTLDRTTDGTGMVGLHSLEQCLALRTRDPETSALTNAAPATLTAALDLCDRLSLGLVLEIKATWGIDAACAAAVLREVPARPGFPLLVTSFSVPALQAARRLRPDLPLGLACLCPPTDPAPLHALGLRAVHINDAFATPARVSALRSAGLGVAVATVNDPGRIAELLAMGAHGVMTDYPEIRPPDPEQG